MSDPPKVAQRQALPMFESIVALPLRIFLVGAAILLLADIWTNWLHFPGLRTTYAWVAEHASPIMPMMPLIIVVLVIITGLAIVALLWWLIDRYFKLIQSGAVTADAASLRDLPLGLPEGTVRAVLALIVAVVGLPILILSGTLIQDHSVAGYINGIIGGVFGFYFGSRTQTASSQALKQIAAAAHNADAVDAAATARIAEISKEMEAAKTSGLAAPLLDKLARQLELNAVLVDPLGKLLPPGTLPSGLAAAVTAADTALKALGSAPGPETVAQATKAIDGLTAGSAIDVLIKTAAPMAGGAPGTLAALLAIGWNCGSAAFQRWSALLLAAPVTAMLLDGGALTATDIATAASAVRNLPKAWTDALAKPEFVTQLAGLILADDAADQLWAAYSAPLASDGLFADRAEITTGLEALRHEILAERFARDLTDGMVQAVAKGLAGAADAALQPGAVTADSLIAAARAAGKASAQATAPDAVRAAFDALVTLVGVARDSNIDLPAALTEVTA